MGQAYLENKEYQNAIEQFMHARDIYSKLVDAEHTRITRRSMCVAQRGLGNYKEALLELRMQEEWLKKSDNIDGIVFEEIAENLLALGYSSSSIYFSKALECFKAQDLIGDLDPKRISRMRELSRKILTNYRKWIVMFEFEYVMSDQLKEAILVSEVTSRPLLLKGEPGTGKTLLAQHVAKIKNIPIFEWHVKSTSLAKDGLYTYDALSRLHDSRFMELDGGKASKVKDISNYIKLEGMGKAFSNNSPCVLLIDEIDKADIEFPNDLLRELDRMEFEILETGQKIKANVRPLVVITSNSEKNYRMHF